nr:hypothetical protein [Nodosilinea sp. TSF1-S3]MDF0367435.1 hypothetical protein [Nodosilinea sp. TSF1-S3]
MVGGGEQLLQIVHPIQPVDHQGLGGRATDGAANGGEEGGGAGLKGNFGKGNAALLPQLLHQPLPLLGRVAHRQNQLKLALRKPQQAAEFFQRLLVVAIDLRGRNVRHRA